MIAHDAPFAEPWQAQLFALTVALNEEGHFSWSEWVTEFGVAIRDREPEAYWGVWSETLVTILDQRGIATSADIAALAKRWQAAARATPHGKPIAL